MAAVHPRTAATGVGPQPIGRQHDSLGRQLLAPVVAGRAHLVHLLLSEGEDLLFVTETAAGSIRAEQERDVVVTDEPLHVLRTPPTQRHELSQVDAEPALDRLLVHGVRPHS